MKMFEGPAWRMAWREARAAAPKFLFVIFGVAAGVGALTGVRGFSAAFHESLKREARTLMAADLLIRQFAEPTEEQERVIAQWEMRGARVSRITETVSMMAAGEGEPPVLVSVKAVDPSTYPWYGRVRLEPDAPLAQALTAETIAVSDDLMLRLNLRPGSPVKLGEAEFRVWGIVRLEPDRMTGSLNVGPRVMVTREGLARTGLLTYGSRASQRLLWKLPPSGVRIEELRESMRRTFREALITDYRETHPFITRALDRATTFLSLVSMIALIVGALGVAMAIHSHIQQRLDTIAIMKCVGARSAQIMRIYTLQAVLLGLAGGVAGLAVGAGVQFLFPLLLRRYFQLESIGWSGSFALEGILAGVLVALLFSVPPLLAIRDVKPALIFRREMPEAKPPLRARVRRKLPAAGAGALILAGLGAMAAWLASSLKVGAWFAGGLVAALAVLGAVAWILLRALKWALAHAPVRLPLWLRHGVANIYRPGNHAASILVAMPKGAPNVFLINITPRELDAMREFLASRRDLEGKPQLVPTVAARLESINGTPLDQLPPPPGEERRRRRAFTRQVTWMDAMPEDMRILRGAWWKDGRSEALASVDENTARRWGIEPGALLEWSASGRRFQVRVAAIHRFESVRRGASDEFVFTEKALAGLPAQWYATARIPPARVAEFMRDSFRRFPSVTVINAADVVSIVQQVVDQVSLVIRFIAAFAILAGAIILASTVAGTRLRRVRESAVLKTLGARRRTLVSIFSTEFAILGAAAGFLGGALATGFARLLLVRLLDARFDPEWRANLATTLLTMALAVATGWLASLRILSHRPLEVLREE
ncbi:MAG: FtsX-like permease family protein [Bryobacteraceae bacterium]|nr:FtsX-like permease family protein [Bryobacteraceae bacterium]